MSLTPSARAGKKYESSLSDNNLLDSPAFTWLAVAALAGMEESSGPSESLRNDLTGEELAELVDSDDDLEGDGELVRIKGDDSWNRSLGVMGGVRRMEDGRDLRCLSGRGLSSRALGVRGGVRIDMVADGRERVGEREMERRRVEGFRGFYIGCRAGE